MSEYNKCPVYRRVKLIYINLSIDRVQVQFSVQNNGEHPNQWKCVAAIRKRKGMMQKAAITGSSVKYTGNEILY